MQSTAALVTSSTPYRVACLQQKVSPFQHSVPTQKLQRRARHTHQAVAQDSSEADTPTNSLFANNPAFAAALQSVAARQGDETLLSAPASAIPEEEPTAPHEDMLLTSLQISRRNIRYFESMKKALEDSIRSEEQQFERLHFAYQKIKAESAYIKHLERRLAQEKAKNQGG